MIDHLNVQCWGNGHIPAIVFHGGPGSGLNPRHTCYFDASNHRVVLFDQRGSGKSGTPGTIIANTLEHTVRDAEAIRMALGIDDWIVLGGSWGGALALAYAEAHPARVRSLVVRSTLISCEAQEQWLFRDRAALFEQGKIASDFFLQPLDVEEQHMPAAAWFARMAESDEQAVEAARRVIVLEAAFHGSLPSTVNLQPDVGPTDLSRSRVYLWYWLNRFFLPESKPANPKIIASVPHRIIHCQDDLICPIAPVRSYAAKGKLNLEVLSNVGHNGLSTEMITAVRKAVVNLGG